MTSPKPLTLSIKLVVLNREGRCLLLKRSASSKNNPCKWDLPGGKMDPGETFDRAAYREVEEETGLAVTIDGPAGTAQSESDTHRIIYLFLTAHTDSTDVRLSDEHEEYAWAGVSELAEMEMVEQFREFAHRISG